MSKESVKRLYAIGAEKYDPLMKLWVKAVAAEAEEEFATFLRDNLDEANTILELGCGTARNLEKIFSLNLKFKNYLGLDFSPNMLKVARRKFRDNPNVEFREKDITLINNADGKYDIIICTWMLSHLGSPSDFVNKTQRLLNKDGRFFLIFLTRPRWYMNFWLYPIATYLFSAKPVGNEEVGKFSNVKVRQTYTAGITTCVEVYRLLDSSSLPQLGKV